jgi:predicted amidohydrolase
MDRRDFLMAAASLSATGGLLVQSSHAATGKGPSNHLMQGDGGYAKVELAKPAMTLGVVQSRIRALNMERWQKELKANLAHMIDLIDGAFYYTAGGRPDLLFFHEFPLTGWKKWTRAEILEFAIEVPGEETEVIARKAKEYGCYIVFGSYVKDRDWPNHVLSITTIIGPDGNIVDKHWKARNIKGVFPEFELFTTTVYDVLDAYIERYGLDAVVPVTRTPLGNICTSSIQREPELFRAMAFKGAELILRTASGGFTPADIQATSMYNQVYTAICNNAASPGNKPFFEDSGGGGSAVYGPDGKILSEADGKLEQLISARIDMAALRLRKAQPIVHMEMYLPIFNAYRNKYGPNLFQDYQPSSLEDAKVYLSNKARWAR